MLLLIILTFLSFHFFIALSDQNNFHLEWQYKIWIMNDYCPQMLRMWTARNKLDIDIEKDANKEQELWKQVKLALNNSRVWLGATNHKTAGPSSMRADESYLHTITNPVMLFKKNLCLYSK